MVETTLQLFESAEFRTLQLRFGSGVSVRELLSVAIILSDIAHLPPPSRSEKRHCGKLASWYQRHWGQIDPWLPIIQLRDDRDQVIDGYRELMEKGLL